MDGIFMINSCEHVLKDFSMTFHFSILPMGYWTCCAPLYAKPLEKPGKFFTVELRAWINLYFGWRTCPAHPVLWYEIDNVLSGLGWRGNCNMKVGTCIHQVIKLKSFSLGICPCYPVQVDSVIKIQHWFQGCGALVLRWWAPGTNRALQL